MLLTKAINILYSIAFTCLIAYLSLFYRFTFNYESYLNQQYALIFWFPLAVLLLIWLYKRADGFSSARIISLLFIASFTAFVCYSYYYSFSNEYFFTLGIIALASYGLYLLKSIQTFRIVVLSFVVLFILQLYLGIQQRFHDTNPLLISGSLQNSGVYAYYLVCSFPFFYWFCFTFYKQLFYVGQLSYAGWVFRLLFVVVSVLVLYLIYCTQSRTAMIGIAVAVSYFGVSFYGYKISAIIKSASKTVLFSIGLAGIGAMLWGGVWLFNLKKLSAVGRLLSLEISWAHISEHFWLGTGLGRFTWYYPQWQASYFESHPEPKLEYFLCADESYIIFNEYLQLFSSIGVFGFLFCCYGCYRFFRLKSSTHAVLLSTVKCTVLVILFSGFTSYPLHVNILLLVLGTCLATGFAVRDRQVAKLPQRDWNVLNKGLVILCAALMSYTFHKGYQHYVAADQWGKARSESSAEGQVLGTYQEIYPLLHADGKFLTEYAALLLTDDADAYHAITILKRAKQTFLTRQSVEALVKAYGITEDYDNAIANQLFLTNYLPNKFEPKYDLLQLYALTDDTVNIRKTGHTILHMPVKISSYRVRKIKQDSADILKQYEGYKD